MATAVQLRRGTTAQHATFTGLLAEVTVDTDKKTLVVNDGATAGGFPLPSGQDFQAVQNDVDTAVQAANDANDNAMTANQTATDALAAVEGRVAYNQSQILTAPQRQQARDNIDVFSKAEVTSAITASATEVGPTIRDAPAKSTPADADIFGYWDTVGAALKNMTWANIKSVLKTYFDTLYPPKNNAALTGIPTAPTATAGTNTTQIATTAFVTTAIAADSSTFFTAETSVTIGTTQQNLSGKPMFIAASRGGTIVSPGDLGYAAVSILTGATSTGLTTKATSAVYVSGRGNPIAASASYVVPAGAFYRVNTSATGTFSDVVNAANVVN